MATMRPPPRPLVAEALTLAWMLAVVGIWLVGHAALYSRALAALGR
jgi:hypothetical protein